MQLSIENYVSIRWQILLGHPAIWHSAALLHVRECTLGLDLDPRASQRHSHRYYTAKGEKERKQPRKSDNVTLIVID